MPKVRLETQKRIDAKVGAMANWLKKNGLGRKDFERKLGVSHATASKYWNNPEKMTIEQLMKLRLNAELRELLTRERI